MKTFRLISLVFTVLISFLAHSQEGHIYLNHFEINESYSDARIRCIAFNDQSSMFLASRKGVAVFNGTEWSHVKNVPANILTIQTDSLAKIIYTGLKDEIGYISQDSTGMYKYISIKQFKENTGEFNQIIIGNDKIYFYSTKSVFIVDSKDNKSIQQIKNDGKSEYSGILTRKGQIFVNIKGIGVCKLQGNDLSPVSDGSKFKEAKILFSTTCNNVNILIGTNDNKLYLFDGKKFVQFSERTQIRDFLNENILWGGFDFSEKYFALSTLTGGCVIIDKVYGKIIYHINYMTGLPDDEIYTMAVDKNNMLWIAHEHGISRCDLNFNIRNYSSYKGIDGNINDLIINDGRLYVASSSGVYILSEIKNTKEKEFFVKEKSKNGFKLVPKKTYITQSVAHKFVQVLNLTEKCKQFYKFNNKLLALSDYGLYEIRDSLAKPIIRDIYINSLCADKDTNVLFAATLKGIEVLIHVENSAKKETKPSKRGKPIQESNWQRKNLFDNLSKETYSIIQDNKGDLVFGADGKAYFAKKDSALSFSKPLEIKFPEKVNEPINVQLLNNKIMFIQSAGIFEYQAKTNSANYKSKREFELRNFRYINTNSNTWIFKDSLWISLDSTQQIANKQYWKLFHKIRKIHIDESKNSWLINGKNELIKILADTAKKYAGDFNVHITGLSDKLDSSYILKKPVIDYERNAIKFSISAPFWLFPEGTLYRFKVKGLTNYEAWSNWSENTNVELSYIPAGKYVLFVSAKNILGQISDEQKLEFTVLEPFWQTGTFYYIAGGAILVIVVLFFYLRNQMLKRKNRILEAKVRERTIELQQEKDKTEELLLNILPKETADELKQNNKVIPRHYELVTVLFTDFKGFTMLAEKLTPSELVHEIDFCFKEFDRIINKYRIEKIKTIGDSYMCAAGLPKEDKKNAIEAVKAALDIRHFMAEHKEQCLKENKPCFEIRIGLHSGKVVAGVVGIKKYAYDIWGDTVNIASRMESSGEPGKVNISGDTYELVKKKFNCTHRGKVEAKNKGLVDMYFVDNEKE